MDSSVKEVWLDMVDLNLSALTREPLFRTLLDSIPEALICIDAGLRIEWLNRQAAEALQVEPEGIHGKGLSELGLVEDPAVFSREINRLVTSPCGGVVTLPLDLAEGRRDFEWRVPLASEHIAAPVVLGMDVTDRVADLARLRFLRERIERADNLALTGVLASAMAHDLNNILMAVLGRARLFLESGGEFDPRQVVEDIERSATYAAELIDQLLAQSKEGIERARADINELVSSMLRLLNSVVKSSATLECKLNRDIPPVRLNPCDFRRMVLNLVVNASDALESRGGKIRLSTGVIGIDEAWEAGQQLVTAKLDPGRFVVVDVVDDGPGMDAATVNRIFEPFYTTKPHGKGLGLASVRRLAHAHGGAVAVNSGVGKGTRFTVLLPVG